MRQRAKRVVAGVVLLAAVLGVASCTPPTTFQGDAQFPGGALGCFNQCSKIKMDMASFVYVGEYSTACACKPKVAGGGTATAANEEQQTREDAAMVSSAAGVELQRRRIEQQQREQLLYQANH